MDGVCDHSDDRRRVLVAEDGDVAVLDRVEAAGEEVGLTSFAVEMRVVRFVGDGLVGLSPGRGSKSRGWFRVATIMGESRERGDYFDSDSRWDRGFVVSHGPLAHPVELIKGKAV